MNVPRLTNRLLTILASKRAFWVIVAIFGFESLWIALSSRYPMAFDEQYHLGLIKLHATTFMPFLHDTPGVTSQFGAVSRDPSFLYHYLFSFPYRILAHMTSNLTIQVLMLRLCNIMLAGAGLIIFRRLLTKLGASTLRTNLVTLFFIWIPIFPLMAGQINYDNLAFVMAGAVLLLGVDFVQEWRQHGHIKVGTFLWLIALGSAASTITYAFLPIVVAPVLYLCVLVARNLTASARGATVWWHASSVVHKLVLGLMLVFGLWLFVGSYGVNLVRYHKPVVQCDQVLSITECQKYPPWHRDYMYSYNNPGITLADLPKYTAHWTAQMMHETFFEVAGAYNGDTVVYFVGGPIMLIHDTAWVLLVLGALALILQARTIWRNSLYRLVLFTLVLYTGALFVTNWQGYVRSGIPVAIHGRYLLPLVLPVAFIAAQGFTVLARRWLAYKPDFGAVLHHWRGPIMTLLVIAWLPGGVISFIVLSRDNWMWPQSQPAIQINHDLRSVLKPINPQRLSN